MGSFRGIYHGSPSASGTTLVSSEGSARHPRPAGSSPYSVKHDGVMPMGYQRSFENRSLEKLLRDYLPSALQLEFPRDAEELKLLSDKLAGAEEAYKNHQSGVWRKIWYSIGDGEQLIDGWVALIPSDFGLAIVKTGLAVVIKLAERSVKRQRKINDAFIAIRNALIRADPHKRSFAADKNVRASADNLTQTITKSIEELIMLTSKTKLSLMERLVHLHMPKRRETYRDADGILQQIAQAREEFEDVVNQVRDRMIATSGTLTPGMFLMLEKIGGFLLNQKDSVPTMDFNQESRHEDDRRHCLTVMKEVETYTRRVAKQDQMINMVDRTAMSHFLRQSRSLGFENKITRQQKSSVTIGIVLKETRLLEILTGLPVTSNADSGDVAHVLHQPSADLRFMLKYKTTISQNTQRQVREAVINKSRFLQWLNCSESDLIMVNANLYPGMWNTPLISIFSGTFITSILDALSEDVVAHYFCDRHKRPEDKWHGPTGLVSFLAMQLLMALMAREENLNMVQSREFIQGLEEHDLHSICHLLHSLVARVPRDVTLYLVIDSISTTDTAEASQDLHIVMQRLQAIINDTSIRATVKILLTNRAPSNGTIMRSIIFHEDINRVVHLSDDASEPATRMFKRVVSSTFLYAQPEVKHTTRLRYVQQAPYLVTGYA